MHSSLQAFALFVAKGSGAIHQYAEIAQPRRVLEFLSGDGDLAACFGKVASLEILHGIKLRAGAQGREQQFRRGHRGVVPAVLHGLVAEEDVASGFDGEPDVSKMRNFNFHG